MEEIKFRALQKGTKDWVYGYYFYSQREDKHYITVDSIDYGFQLIEVDPDSVGQYVGLHDKNRVEIYKGDIVNVYGSIINNSQRDIIFVDFCNYDVENAKYVFGKKKMDFGVEHSFGNWYEVIGNVFEHPELLEGGAE